MRANLAGWAREGRRAIIFTSHQPSPAWASRPVRRATWAD
jgi:hypothetical protein